jgi:hypothetical protein
MSLNPNLKADVLAICRIISTDERLAIAESDFSAKDHGIRSCNW